MEIKRIEYFTELYNKEGVLNKVIMHYEDGSSEEQEFITQAKSNDEQYNNILEFITLWNDGIEESGPIR
jgi:hypothetical protein